MPETKLEAKLQPPKRMQLRVGPLHKNRAVNLMNTNKRWQSTYKWALAKLGAVAENTGIERLLVSIIKFNAQTDAAWKKRLGNQTPAILAQSLARDPESAAATLEDFGNRTNGPMFLDMARQIRENPTAMATPTGNFNMVINTLDAIGNALASNINKGAILSKVPVVGKVLSYAANYAPTVAQAATSVDSLTRWAFNALGLPETGSAVAKASGAAQTPWRPGVDQFSALAGARVQLESERQKLKQLQESGAQPQVIERQTKIINDRSQELNRASQAVGTYRAQTNPNTGAVEGTKNLAGDITGRLVGQQSLELMRGLAKVGIPVAMFPTLMNSLAEFKAQNNGAPYTYDQIIEAVAKTGTTGLASWASLHPEKFSAFMRNVTPTTASNILNKFGPAIKSVEALSALKSKVSELGTGVGKALSRLPGGAAAVSKVAPLGGLAARAFVPYTIAENTLTGLTAGIRGFTDPRYQAYLEGLRQQHRGSTPLDVAMNIPRALISSGGRDALMGSVGSVVSNDAQPVDTEGPETAARTAKTQRIADQLEKDYPGQYSNLQRLQMASNSTKPLDEEGIKAYQGVFDNTLANLSVAFPSYSKDDLYLAAMGAAQRQQQAQAEWKAKGVRAEPISDFENALMTKQTLPNLNDQQRLKVQSLIRFAGPEHAQQMVFTPEGEPRPEFINALNVKTPDLELGYQHPDYTRYLTGQPLQNDAAAVNERAQAAKAQEQELRNTDPSGLEFNKEHQQKMMGLKQQHATDTQAYEQQQQQAQAEHVAMQNRIRAEANKPQPSHSQALAGVIPPAPAPGQPSGFEQAMARYKRKGYMLPKKPYTISGFGSPIAKKIQANKYIS